jgi:hypothetical protein
MDVLRTPDDRFANLPGYNFPPHYLDNLTGYEGLRVHYVDQGAPNAPFVPQTDFLAFIMLNQNQSVGFIAIKLTNKIAP